MLKKAIIAALFFLVVSPSFAANEGLMMSPPFADAANKSSPNEYKESAICFIGDKTIIFTETETISYRDLYTILYLPYNKDRKQGQFWIPTNLGSCIYIKDYQGQYKLLETLNGVYPNAIVVETKE